MNMSSLKAKPSPALLEAKLADLGATPEAVAEALRVRGCKGVMGDGDSCVLANFLKDEFKAGTVAVDRDFIVVKNGGEANIQTPNHLVRFINLFDEEAYPFLVDQTAVRGDAEDDSFEDDLDTDYGDDDYEDDDLED